MLPRKKVSDEIAAMMLRVEKRWAAIASLDWPAGPQTQPGTELAAGAAASAAALPPQFIPWDEVEKLPPRK